VAIFKDYPRYSVKTGYIYLDDNKTSKQIDILIIDENTPFTYIFQDKDFVIVRPEPVIATIEVKTELDLPRFREAFDNVLVAKKLKTEALGGLHKHMYGSVFGYFSNKDLNSKTLDKWFKDSEISKYESEPSSFWPNSIFFFDHGLFLHLDDGQDFDKEDKLAYYYKLFRMNEESDKAWQLALLITFIVAYCENENSMLFHQFNRPKSLELVDFSKVAVSHDRFRPMQGHTIKK